MLTTIEQKLSAMKAINNAKDQAELNQRFCITIKQSSCDKISFSNGLQFTLPKEVRDKMVDLMHDHYKKETQDLISQAEHLMK